MVVVSVGGPWELEDFFASVPGVLHTEVAYCGGTTTNPTLHEMGDHEESVRVEFNPRDISLEEILNLACEFALDHNVNLVKVFFIGDEKDEIESWISVVSLTYPPSLDVQVAELRKYKKAEEFHQKHLAKLRGDMLKNPA